MPANFYTFLEKVSAEGGFPTDDVLRIVLPLFEQVQAVHEAGKVAPLEGTSKIHFDEKDILQFELNDAVNPRHRLFGTMAALIQNTHGSGVEVVAERRVVTDFSEEVTTKAEELTESEAHLKLPKFLPGYVTWEHQSGHHDPLSDIFSLGLLLASVGCGLDLNNDDDFQIFVENRTYLFAINSRLNPVIASVIVQMTELQRSKRAPDLVSLIQKLRNYRGQPTEYDFDLNRLTGFQESDIIGKRRLIQRHLRDRLFEISRRNRLLYFKPSQQQVNLTLSSVPAVMDYKNIRLDQLFVWHEQVAELIAKQTVIPLNRFVRFDDAPYVPELLEKIISEAKRDRTEYGFAQLKLVICFLRWNNLKEAPQERIISPLLLVPVELTKKKGVRDSFTLQSLSSVAELNPVLRHHLKQLYNLDLPQAIDLSETTLDKFHEHLARQIQSSEQAVTIRKIDKPQIEIVHQKARQRLDQYRKRQKLSSHTVSGYSKLNHSYKKEDFRPMGLQLFLQKVRVPASPFEAVLGQITEHPMPQYIVNGEIDSKKSANVIEKEKLTYNLRDPEDQNPYIWGFDLCNITPGNFNYRKMSLVADYNHLVDKDLPNPAFDRIFSLQPKALPSIKKPELPLGEQFTVVACDPTQAGAIAQARQGESFIIQGPPGYR